MSRLRQRSRAGARNSPLPRRTPRRCRRCVPLHRRVRLEGAQRAAGEQVALNIERVVGGGVHQRKPLAEPGDLNRCFFGSRRRTGWCEISARLFFREPCRHAHLGEGGFVGPRPVGGDLRARSPVSRAAYASACGPLPFPPALDQDGQPLSMPTSPHPSSGSPGRPPGALPPARGISRKGWDWRCHGNASYMLRVEPGPGAPLTHFQRIREHLPGQGAAQNVLCLLDVTMPSPAFPPRQAVHAVDLRRRCGRAAEDRSDRLMAQCAARLRRSRVMAPGRPRTFSTRPVSSYSSDRTRALSYTSPISPCFA